MSAALQLTGEDYAYSRLISYAAYQWPGYRDAAHHRLIARHLEAVERGEIKRLMITMPPRHGKSMLASEFFPAWYMGRNPDHYVVTATYAQELADDFGRKVKNQIEDSAYQGIFPGVGLADDSKSAKRFHIEGSAGGIEHVTSQRGAFYAVGVGGPLTGRGAHLLLIDDPVKNREDAESEVIRKKTKDWYTSTAYTRLMPGGRIVVIQCMVGDTHVLMADGTKKCLRDLSIGDSVATYKNGKISTSFIMNWANQGSDNVYEIRTTSGILTKANERHPFLVERGENTEWVRLKDLKVGDRVLRVTGANGAASPAHTMDVSSQPKRAGSACPTTTKPAGLLETTRRPSTQHIDAPRISAIDTELTNRTTTECSQSRMVSAPFAASPQARTCEPIGAESSASITTMRPERFEACCVTTATSQSDTARPLTYCPQPLYTYEIIPDEIVEIVPAGREDVFDIQVAGTENFIANGLVSHNTRWHEDDLAGWLQTEHGHEGWVVLDLPAINDNGEALWPEQYDLDALQQIERALPPRDWSALYQQRPSPETGDYFKREWVVPVSVIPPKSEMSIYGGSDYAVTADGGDFTVHAVVGLDTTGRMYLLDLWRQQASSDVWVDAFCALVKKWKPIGWAEETGQIKSGVGPFLVKRMIETDALVAREQFPTRGDKAVRAQSIRGRMALQGLHVPADAPWLSSLISEMMSFPVGVHDDQVDALGLVGQLIDRMSMARAPKAENVKVNSPKVVADGVIAPPLRMGRRH